MNDITAISFKEAAEAAHEIVRLAPNVKRDVIGRLLHDGDFDVIRLNKIYRDAVVADKRRGDVGRVIEDALASAIGEDILSGKLGVTPVGNAPADDQSAAVLREISHALPNHTRDKLRPLMLAAKFDSEALNGIARAGAAVPRPQFSHAVEQKFADMLGARVVAGTLAIGRM